MSKYTEFNRAGLRGALLLGAALGLAGCQGLQFPGASSANRDDGSATVATAAEDVAERDVEAPEIFEAKEDGLWDGRPSLGGVWVAHPQVKDPERVIVRNETNGAYVIGALFRKERDIPGPRIQVSSDAAAALNMLAGQPTKLSVVALRRETIAAAAEPEPQPTGALDAPSTIQTGTIDDLAATASAALDDTPAAPKPAAAASTPPTARPAAAASAAKSSSALAKPYVQIGIFSIEQNANNTATAMRGAGMVPTVRKQTSKGKTFWRVLVGPANTSSEIEALLKAAKAQGFSDAYAVSN